MNAANQNGAGQKPSTVGGGVSEDEQEKAGAAAASASQKAPRGSIQNHKTLRAKKQRGQPKEKAEGVAVIGLACRLPGAENAQVFWENLVHGKQSIRRLPRDRWDADRVHPAHLDKDHGTKAQWFGLLDQIDRFDNRFFNISPREARHMDPQQRLLMEQTWRCIENSGVALSALQQKKTSVHVGVSVADYHHGSFENGSDVDPYTASGNYPCITANRLSYFFGLTGPSMATDAACATSLVALGLARETLLSGECDYAIAATASLSLLPWRYQSFSKSRMLSPDGKCKTFDAKADGFVPGEGIVVLLLRPLHKARAEGDHIYGVIRGLAVNHGGRSQSLTAPRVQAQKNVILKAYEQTDFDPSAVSYVETHGTGTSLGDPIEVEALTRAFRQQTQKRQFCRLGSVKTNIGHVEASAGLAGVVKVLLMMGHRMIPASMNLTHVNPIIDFGDSPFKIATKLTPWKATGRGKPLRAGVSCFGFGGTNAHCLLESAFAYPLKRKKRVREVRDELFLVSARSGGDMDRMLAQWRRFVDSDSFDQFQLGDVCATLQTGRCAFPIRFGGRVAHKQDLKKLLTTPPACHSKTKNDPWILRLEPFELSGWQSLTTLSRQNPLLAKHLESMERTASQMGLISQDSFFSATWPESQKSLFTFMAAYGVVASLMALGFRPERVVFFAGTTWLGLALCEVLSLEDALRSVKDPSYLKKLKLKRPKRPFFDPVNRFRIDPIFFEAGYLSALTQGLRPSPFVLKQFREKAGKLRQNQHTLIKYLQEWQVVCDPFGLSTEQWLSRKDLASSQTEQDLQASLIHVVIIESCLRRLNQKWELADQRVFPEPRFLELCDLIVDEVITKTELVQWLTGACPDLTDLAMKMNARQARLDPKKPYALLKVHNQTLVEVGDEKGWLNEVLSLPSDGEITFSDGATQLVVGDGAVAPNGSLHLSLSESPNRAFRDALLRLWLKGVAIEWDRLVPGGSFQKLPLPTYPFKGKRFWLLKPPDAQVASTKPPVAETNPLEVQKQALLRDAEAAATEDLSDFFYIPKWEHQVLKQNPVARDGEIRQIWIFQHDQGPDLRQHIIDHHPGAQFSHIYLKTGTDGPADRPHVVDVQDVLGFERVVEELGSVDAIYYLGGLIHFQPIATNFDEIAAQNEMALMGLFRLFKALVKKDLLLAKGHAAPPLYMTVLTNDVHAVLAGDRTWPGAGGLPGFMRTMAKEFPNLKMKCPDISLDGLGSKPSKQALEPLLAPLFLEDYYDHGRDIAYRGGRRYIRTHYPFDLPKTTASLFKKNGVYVIIGGAKGVGYELSRFLARQFAARLALVGRSSLGAETARRIAEIQTNGGEAQYFQADVSDLEAMRAVFAAVRSRFSTFHGVIHSAVVFNEVPIKEMDEAQFRAVLAPKVQGSIVMGRLLQDANLDFLLFFGSGQSYTGNLGRSHYAAGCTFSDAFALSLVGRLPFPVKIINWGFWHVGAMSGEEFRKQMDRLKAHGVQPIDSKIGPESVHRFMGHQLTQALAVRVQPKILELMGVSLHRRFGLYPESFPSLMANGGPRFDTTRPESPELSRFLSGFRELEKFSRFSLLRIFQRMGVLRSPGEVHEVRGLRDALSIAPRYHGLFEELIRILQAGGYLTREHASLRASALVTLPEDVEADLTKAHDLLHQSHPQIRGHLRILMACLSKFEAILVGQVPATEVMFPNASMALVEGYYKGNALAGHMNAMVTESTRAFLQARLPLLRGDEPLRILEVGAGTGGTTEVILKGIKEYGHRCHFTYTDISKAFALYGKRQYGELIPAMDFRTLNVEKDPTTQGFEPDSYDLVIANNVLHATRNLRHTLANVKRLLKRHGWLLINEVTQIKDYTTLTFGLLEGWWLFDDPENRLPGSPLMNTSMWKQILREEGYGRVLTSQALRVAQEPLPQTIIIAESDGGLFFEKQAVFPSRSTEAQESGVVAPRPKPSATEPEVVPPQPAAKSGMTAAEIQSAIRRCLAQALEMESAQFDAETPLQEYGVDSLVAVEIINKINGTLGIDLRSTDLYNYVTIEALTTHVLDVFAPPAVVAGEPEAQVVGEGTVVQRPPTSKPKISGICETVAACIASAVEMKASELDWETPVGEFGVDSLVSVEIIRHINFALEIELQATDLYNYVTINALAGHIREVFGTDMAGPEPALPLKSEKPHISISSSQSSGESKTGFETSDVSQTVAAAASPGEGDIAVIGLSARFPGADNVAEYWRLLSQGTCAVSEIPQDRWRWQDYFDPDPEVPNKCNGKWGGFLSHINRFDPLFFKISPAEAELMDPQQRLFLMEAFKALEDAGYSDKALAGKKCGVFVGCEDSDYKSMEPEINAATLSGHSIAILASRISYFLNLKGPSVPIHTACSSSLVAAHFACESLRSGTCDMALLGGVSLFPTPKLFVAISKSGMMSPSGRCRTFDEGADGFVPAEGVAAVILKKHSHAIRDGDQVYGIIKGTAINQDGKTNGITAPNGPSQTELVAGLYDSCRIPPESLGYVEAHGTGTRLGDPIEVNALTDAFGKRSDGNMSCAIGSVKTNIGHTLAASGMASLVKLILCLQHRKLVPSLGFVTPNQHISFEDSPFYVNTRLVDWEKRGDQPRRAGISAFGFSGTNAHLVLEEAPPLPVRIATTARAHLFALSARTSTALAQKLNDLQKFVDEARFSMADLAFTLGVGRSHFEFRAAFVVGHQNELAAALRTVIAGGTCENYMAGEKEDHPWLNEIGDQLLDNLNANAADDKSLDQKLRALAKLYVQGMDVAWERLPTSPGAKRISLPTYPFDEEVYWLSHKPAPSLPSVTGPHPFLDENLSTFTEHRFLKRFTLEEPLIRDHRVAGDWVLPGAAIVEMARAAGSLMGGQPVVGLKNLVFAQPVRPLGEAGPIYIRLKRESDWAQFEVYSNGADESEIRHAQGKLVFSTGEDHHQPEALDIQHISSRCSGQHSGSDHYRKMAGFGLDLGPSFQVVDKVQANEKEGFAHLEMPQHLRSDAHRFVLHPALLDAAQQVSVMAGLMGPDQGIQVPFTISEIQVYGSLTDDCVAHVVARPQPAGARINRCDIRIGDRQGRLLAAINGFLTRSYGKRKPNAPKLEVREPDCVFLQTFWETRKRPSPARVSVNVILVLGDVPGISNRLEKRIPEKAGVPVRMLLVRTGEAFSDLGNGKFEMDPQQPDHFAQLVSALETQNLMPNQIIHLWCLTQGEPSDASLEPQLSGGLDSLYHLARALWAISLQHLVRLVFVHAAENGQPLPALAATGGFARTLALEHPRLACTSLCLHGDDPGDPEYVAKALTSELLNGGKGEAEARFRNGKRQILGLRESGGLAPEGSPKASIPVSIRPEGVYLITGGAGQIGMLFAEYLTKKYKARIALIGRSPLDPEKQARIEAWRELGATISYHRADLARKIDVLRVLFEVKARFGRIHGVIHAAGITRDGNLGRKSLAQLRAVIAPKVMGTVNLDDALGQEGLDFFVLFSSTTALLGYQGQSDYAFANRFLDYFAQQRESRRMAGQRFGKNRVINWPLWKQGGMALNQATEQRILASWGMRAMATSNGLLVFEQSLAAEAIQQIVIQGDRQEILQALVAPPEPEVATQAEAKPVTQDGDPDLVAAISSKLVATVSELMKVPQDRIRMDKNLSDYGFDSLSLTQFANRINAIYRLDITPAHLFEYPSLKSFTHFLFTSHRESCGGFHSSLKAQAPPADPTLESLPDAVPTQAVLGTSSAASQAPKSNVTDLRQQPNEAAPIAIIGMSGRMPQSEDLQAFWQNLEAGKNLITEIPKDRWDWKAYWGDPNRQANKTMVKWGGFMEDVDKFDAHFFEISRREAELMDPQQRIFLETVWKVFEDAGYRASQFAGRPVGIYAGVSGSDYSELLKASQTPIEAHTTTGTLHSILANRVSYLLGFRGPSLAIDTACSSALVAICQAVSALRRNECELAVAGGINLLLSPSIFISFNKAGMLSLDGRCKTFDESANGYVRAEGVGALLLKPLDRALADRDAIHAVIRGTAVNHGGRVNTLTAPNPNAQAELIVSAFEEAHIDPASAGYMEAHGTGTSLGDPIEVNGLKKAFQVLFDRRKKKAPQKPYCGIGSAKSNVGHLETCAAMSGIFKVILAMQHGKIPANINFKKLNPYIDLKDSPFYVVSETQPWERMKGSQGETIPRRAGVSSFGFGGVNGHLVIEEFIPTSPMRQAPTQPHLIVLSAKNRQQLQVQAGQLRLFLEPLGSTGAWPSENLVDELRGLCAEILGVTESELDPNEALAELGFEGVHWAALANRLAQKHVQEIELSELMELKNLKRMANYLAHRYPFPSVKLTSLSKDKRCSHDGSNFPFSLGDVAYTLQRGREPMAARLAMVVSSFGELAAGLKAFAGEHSGFGPLWTGLVDLEGTEALPVLSETEISNLQTSERKGLEHLAELWVKGMDCDWDLIHREPAPRRVHLPTYPFARERFWIPTRNADTQAGASTRHPLIDQLDANLSLDKRLILRKTLRQEDPIIDQHQVGGICLFPGVGHLLMAHGGARELGYGGVIELSQVLWLRPVVLTGTKCAIKLAFVKGETGSAFEIWSGEADQKVIHAKGLLEQDRAPNKARHLPLNDVKARCARHFESKDLYQAIAKTGVVLGPYFQTMQQVWMGENEALARLSLAPEYRGEAKQYFIQPGLLDGALQTYGALSVMSDHGPRLPFAVEKVTFHQNCGEEAWVHLRMIDEMRFHVDLFDTKGRPCISLEEVTLRETTPQTATPGFLYAPYWQRQSTLQKPNAPDGVVAKGSGPVLIVTPAHDFGLAEQLRRAHPDQDVCCIRFGQQTVERDQWNWDLCLKSPSGFQDIMDRVPHPQKVYFLGGLHEGPVDLGQDHELAHSQTSSLVALFRLLKAFQKRNHLQEPLHLVVISNDVYQVHPHDRVSAFGAALPGMALSLGKEYAHWSVAVVDIQSGDGGSQALIPLLTAALATDTVTAIRGNGRYIRQLRPLRLVGPCKKPFRSKGVYLILGGTGGLGLVLARHLARKAQARLALVGRQELTRERQQKIREIESLGAQVLYLKADAGEAQQLRAAVTKARAHFGHIHGAFHSAMELRDMRFEKMSEQDLLMTLVPKAQGCLSLSQALKDEPLDFMVFFSSSQSFTGNFGQSNYAAACTFEDGFATSLAQSSAFPVRIINWGYWGSVGVVATEAHNREMAQRGIGSIEPQEGIKTIEQALSQPLPQLVAIKADRRHLHQMGVRFHRERWVAAGDAHVPSFWQAPQPGVSPDPNVCRMLENANRGVLAVERFAAQMLVAVFRDMGVFRTGEELYERELLKAKLAILPQYSRLLDAFVNMLSRAGFTGHKDSKIQLLPVSGQQLPKGLGELEARKADLLAQFPDQAPRLRLLWRCLQNYPSILRGHVQPTEILFPEGGMDVVATIYAHDASSAFFNRTCAQSLASYVASRAKSLEKGKKIRILEVGAGTGSVSREAFEALSPFADKVEYHYTDISLSFIHHGKRNFASKYPFTRFGMFHLEKDVESQNYEPFSFDVVIAANVVHATSRIRNALNNLKALLKPFGWLILNEGTRTSNFASLTFGLLDGWWAYQDDDLRLPASPFLDLESWKRRLQEEGFDNVQATGGETIGVTDLGQHVLLAKSNGMVDSFPKVPSTDTRQRPEIEAQDPPPETPSEASPEQTRQHVSDHLRRVLGQVLQTEFSTLKANKPFSSLGVDSILAIETVKQINDDLGTSLRNTDLFNFPNIGKLADHIVVEHGESLQMHQAPEDHTLSTPIENAEDAPLAQEPAPPTAVFNQPDPACHPDSIGVDPSKPDLPEPIAVIGLSGRFPDADGVDQFWRNLLAAKHSVRPITRWPVEDFFDPDPAKADKSYGKWAAFLSQIDLFDPAFFDITPAEAEQMDPRQRLFLEETWRALEDAGYSDIELEGKKCGVFVGCGPGDYKLNHSQLPANAYTFSGSQNSILAARISYFLDLKGSSVAVDTACSSSLVALHLACESLRSGACDMAIVGGTEIMTTPEFFIQASRTNMLAADGRCKAFDQDANGLVPGEAVGVVILKRQHAARSHRDPIHGLILGSGLNQDGNTNGITAPSAPSQTALACEVYDRFGIDPNQITYVEAHGTGTKLGDPIEIAALTDAFRKYTNRVQYCAVGSVKTNIGHTMTAAGITGFLKVLLCLKHRQLVPSINLKKENEFIDFRNSPFFVNTKARPWDSQPGVPRTAAISSFGFSGTNAHIVVCEAPMTSKPASSNSWQLIPLSAKTEASLQGRIRDLADWLVAKGSRVDLADVAFTLQTGRSHFNHRMAWLTRSVDGLIAQLQGADQSNRFDGREESQPGNHSRPSSQLEPLITLATRFVAGATEMNWSACHEGKKVKRISLPTYPFDRQRYWPPAAAAKPAPNGAKPLHPMIDRNCSGLEGLRFGSLWNGSEFFLRDHVVKGRNMLPGVCYLELARAAGNLASHRQIGAVTDAVWLEPLTLGTGPREVSIRLTPQTQGLDFRVETQAPSGTIHAHAEGRLLFEDEVEARPPQPIELELVKAACPQSVSGAKCYENFKELGFDYGPAFRVIQRLNYGHGQALASLELPVALLDEFETFRLHPSLLDGALQAGFWLTPEAGRNETSFIPFGVGALHIHAPLTPVCHVHVTSVTILPQIMKLDVRLYDEAGHPLLSLIDYAAKIETTPSAADGATVRSFPSPFSPVIADPMDEALLELFRKVQAEHLSLDQAVNEYEELSASNSK